MEDQKEKTVSDRAEAATADPKEEVDALKDDDDELNDLLESALKDFTEKKLSSSAAETKPKASSSKPKNNSLNKSTGKPKVDEIFQSLVDGDPVLSQQWSKLAESCQKAATAQTDQEFEESLSETLKNLTENAKSFAENPNFSDEEMSKIWNNLQSEGIDLGNLGNPSSDGGLPDVMPLVANMMQNLLSKEVLYPALKDLTAKYPEWLNQNKDQISAEDLNRFTKQLNLMRVVCDEFDQETSSDSEDIKTERFKRIMNIMQEMQQCGSPPKDLVGEVGEPDSVDFSKIPGFPNTENGPSGCIVM